MQDYQVVNLPSPDLTEAEFVAILAGAHSPALGAASAVWNYCRRRGVSPAFLLAMFKVESAFGTKGTATQTRSWGNTRSPSFGGVTEMGTVPGRSGVFPVFKDWIDGGISTAARWLDHAPYAGKTTVAQIIPVWAPPNDQNDTPAYIRNVLASITEWTKGAPPVALQKPTVDTSHPSPNRNGYAGTRRVDAVTWHITEGTNSLGWLTSPASGASSNYLLSRAGTIYELVPPTEDAWANGDVQKPNTTNPLIAKWGAERVNFNQRTISLEHEGFTSKGQGGSLTAAQIKATVALTAWLCDRFGITPDRTHIMPHAWINSVTRPNCPGFSEAEWVAWTGTIAALVGGTTPVEGGDVKVPARGTAVSYLTEDGQPVTVIAWDGEATKIDGTAFVDLGISVTNKQAEKWSRSLVKGVMKDWAKRP